MILNETTALSLSGQPIVKMNRYPGSSPKDTFSVQFKSYQ